MCPSMLILEVAGGRGGLVEWVEIFCSIPTRSSKSDFHSRVTLLACKNMGWISKWEEMGVKWKLKERILFWFVYSLVN